MTGQKRIKSHVKSRQKHETERNDQNQKDHIFSRRPGLVFQKWGENVLNQFRIPSAQTCNAIIHTLKIFIFLAKLTKTSKFT